MGGTTRYYRRSNLIRPKAKPVTVKSSISLTDDQHSFAKTLVESGRYPSVSAVLQQGIELLRQQMEDEALERAALVEILGKRRSGQFLSATKMDSRLAR
jgi:antitoxin ParD1/3/4